MPTIEIANVSQRAIKTAFKKSFSVCGGKNSAKNLEIFSRLSNATSSPNLKSTCVKLKIKRRKTIDTVTSLFTLNSF